MSIITDIKNENVNEEVIIKNVETNNEIILELLEGILFKNDQVRFTCFNILLKISEDNPEVLYKKWDFFDQPLVSENNYHKYIAIHILSNLIKIDAKNKFEKNVR